MVIGIGFCIALTIGLIWSWPLSWPLTPQPKVKPAPEPKVNYRHINKLELELLGPAEGWATAPLSDFRDKGVDPYYLMADWRQRQEQLTEQTIADIDQMLNPPTPIGEVVYALPEECEQHMSTVFRTAAGRAYAIPEVMMSDLVPPPTYVPSPPYTPAEQLLRRWGVDIGEH